MEGCAVRTNTCVVHKEKKNWKAWSGKQTKKLIHNLWAPQRCGSPAGPACSTNFWWFQWISLCSLKVTVRVWTFKVWIEWDIWWQQPSSLRNWLISSTVISTFNSCLLRVRERKTRLLELCGLQGCCPDLSEGRSTTALCRQLRWFKGCDD